MIRLIITSVTLLFFLILFVFSLIKSIRKKTNLLFVFHYLIFVLIIGVFLIISQIFGKNVCYQFFTPFLIIVGLFDFFVIHKLVRKRYIIMDKQRFHRLTYIEKLQGERLGEQKSITEMIHTLLIETDITAVFYTTLDKVTLEMVVRLWDESNVQDGIQLNEIQPIVINDLKKTNIIFELFFKKFRTCINLSWQMLQGKLSDQTNATFKNYLKSFFLNFLPLYETEDNYYSLIFFKQTIIRDLNIVKLFAIQAVNALRIEKQQHIIQTSNQELNHLFELQKFLTEDLKRDDLLRNTYYILAKNLSVDQLIIFRLSNSSLIYRGIWDYSEHSADLTNYKNDKLSVTTAEYLRQFNFNISPNEFISLIPERYSKLLRKQIKCKYFSILPVRESETEYTIIILPSDNIITNADFYIKFFSFLYGPLRKINLLENARRENEITSHVLEEVIMLQQSQIIDESNEITHPEYAIYFQPYSKIGGDLYAVYRLKRNIIAGYMIDTLGHNITSSVISLLLKNLFLLEKGKPVKSVDNALNDLAIRYKNCNLPPDMYATMFYYQFNRHDNILSVSNAAHPYFLYYRPSNDEIITFTKKTDPIWNATVKPTYPIKNIAVQPGDVMLLYTDGIFEHLPSSRKKTVSKTITTLVIDNHKKPVKQLLDIVLDYLLTGCPNCKFEDDVTIKIIKF